MIAFPNRARSAGNRTPRCAPLLIARKNAHVSREEELLAPHLCQAVGRVSWMKSAVDAAAKRNQVRQPQPLAELAAPGLPYDSQDLAKSAQVLHKCGDSSQAHGRLRCGVESVGMPFAVQSTASPLYAKSRGERAPEGCRYSMPMATRELL